jgi:predicted nucleic acid-binding protein
MILQVLIAMAVGWLQRQQQQVMAYLLEENRVLQAQLGGRQLRLTNTERRRLAALALASTDAMVILDDALARQMATTLAMRFRGSLGVLLDAKQAGLVAAIPPLLEQLQALGFHLSSATRKLILDLAASHSDH